MVVAVVVVVVSVVGLPGAVDDSVKALCAAAKNVLAEAAKEGDDRELLRKLEDEWKGATAYEGQPASKQLWWAIDDDDLDLLRAAFKPILVDHNKHEATQGTVPIDRIAWSIGCHQFSSEH